MTADPVPVRLRVVQRIRYRFERPVAGAQISLMLTPRALAHQQIEHHQLLSSPRGVLTEIQDDAFGNSSHALNVDAAFRELEITALSTVALRPIATSASARTSLNHALLLSGLKDVDARGQTCQTLATRGIAQLRECGIEARYVAGCRVAKKRCDTVPHAWIGVRDGGDGWVDFDPTTGEIAPRHLTLAWGHGYDDVAPVTGSLLTREGVRFRQTSHVRTEPLGLGA